MNPVVSVIILTKNRSRLLRRAVNSVCGQNFSNIEVIIVDDGSVDDTQNVLESFKAKIPNLKILRHNTSAGIILSRQEALAAASGELVAFLDDDDEWVDPDKLVKQVSWFEDNANGVICGGGIKKIPNSQFPISNKIAMRPESDSQIRKWMLLKNPFFTSTVMLKRSIALQVGGFVKDEIDLAEDYDLWLRMGEKGKMHNFQEVFTSYTFPGYNKNKLKLFFKKQAYLIKKHKKEYPNYWISSVILKLRCFIGL